jgi:hypothetical protein
MTRIRAASANRPSAAPIRNRWFCSGFGGFRCSWRHRYRIVKTTLSPPGQRHTFVRDGAAQCATPYGTRPIRHQHVVEHRVGQRNSCTTTKCVSAIAAGTAVAGLKIVHGIGEVPALLPSEQLYELFNGESGVRDDAAERAGSKPLVLGYNGPGVRLVAAQNHVATRLAAEDEPSALKGGADLEAGHIGWQFSHVAISRGCKFSAYAATISTNSLPASVGMGSPASRQSST